MACEGLIELTPLDAGTAEGGGGATGVASSALEGAELYQQNCASCHGPQAEGAPVWSSSIQGYAPIEPLVVNGRGTMPGIPLPTQDISRIQEYLLSLAAPAETLDGAGLYGRYCSSCHGADATGTAIWATSIQGYEPIDAIVANGRGDMEPVAIDAAQTEQIQAYLLTLAPPLATLSGPEVYERLCVGCHGDAGAGIDTKGTQLRYDDDAFSRYWVRAGRSTTAYDSAMPAYPEEMISDAQLEQMFAWINAQAHPSDGEGLFNQFCANCHGQDGRGGPSGEGIAGSDDDFTGVARNGKGDSNYGNRGSYMTSWTVEQLSDEQIQLLAAYARAL